MDIKEASGIILKTVHESIEGSIVWSEFLQSRTSGYNEQAATQLKATYSRALIILMDEGLCHKVPNTDIIELGQKGIEYKGDYNKFIKKKKTVTTLEKLRRIAPIVSAIIVIISFIITIITRNAKKASEARKAAHTTVVKPKEGKKEPRK